MANPKPLQIPGKDYSEDEETLFRRKLESQLLELETRLEQAERRDGTVSSLASKRSRYVGLPTGQTEVGGSSGGGSGTVTEVTGGDGITVTDPTTTPEVSLDLKANGGAIISGSELAVDLSASGITGDLAVSDGGTGASTASAARTNLGCGTGDGTVTAVTGTGGVASTGGTTPAISLVNDSVTVGSTSIALGATGASISGLTHASGSISSGVTATTQAVMNESTEVATTAYVDRVALGPAYGSFSKSWGPDTGRNPTITKGAGIIDGNFFPQETGWTENITSVLWEENEDGGGTPLGTFSYTGDYPDSGSRKFVAHWGINLWYYVAASYVALAGRIMKTPSGGSEALVPGSLQVTSWDHYLLWLGNYYYIKHVSGTAMFEISSASDTIQFDYGVNSTYGSGTTTLIAYQAYGSGATLNIQALD